MTLRLAIVLTLVAAAPALAAPDANGYTWATIGHAGNRPTVALETPFRPSLAVGAVNYEYRMATTEVTVGRSFAFIRTYGSTMWATCPFQSDLQ